MACVIAVDLASKTDMAAIALLFQHEEKIVAFGRYYLPHSAIALMAHGRLRTAAGPLKDG
jgi:phage terminase large subunit-like protein